MASSTGPKKVLENSILLKNPISDSGDICKVKKDYLRIQLSLQVFASSFLFKKEEKLQTY